MSVEQRILICRLLEKMNDEKEYSRKLGLENKSIFHGVQIKKDA